MLITEQQQVLVSKYLHNNKYQTKQQRISTQNHADITLQLLLYRLCKVQKLSMQE